MYEWNKPFQLVMKIKNDYEIKYGLDTLNFETWLEKLHDIEYDSVFECLQTNQHNEFLLIRYGLQEMQESMWINPESIYREFRSVVIDLEKEKLVLAPFRKFFNLNEVQENDIEVVSKEIEKAKVIEFTNKLDGSMQSARYYNDDYFMTGSMAIDKSDSWRLEDGYNMLTDNYKKMLYENQDFTFIFEYISLKDAHVVMYDKAQEGLYLIGMRNIYTGEELYYNDVKVYAEKYNVLMTQIENITLEKVLEDMKTYKSNEKEGWVMNVDGHRIKIKCDDYIQLHRLLDYVSSINVIIRSIADGYFDDLIAKVPKNYVGRIRFVASRIYEFVKNTNDECRRYYKLAPKDSQKDFMIWCDANCPKQYLGYVKNIYYGKEFNVLKRRTDSYKKLNELGIKLDYSALFYDMDEK